MGGIVRYYNLTGGLNTISGLGTINQSPKRTESPDMQNVEYYKLSGLQSMAGNTRFSDTVFQDEEGTPATITLGHEYILKDEKYLLVTTYTANESKLWIYNRLTNVFDEIYKFPTATLRHSIVSFNNGVVVSNGVDDLLFYQKGRNTLLSGNVNTDKSSTTLTGTETQFQLELGVGDFINIEGVENNPYRVVSIESDTSLTLDRTPTNSVSMTQIRMSEISLCNAEYINADKATTPVRGLALQSYKGRIWVGGEDGVLYYSEIGLIHGWDVEFGAGSIPEFYNDNSDFTALALWDKYLVVCKREQSYLLNASDVDDTNWTIEPYSKYTCDSQQSWIDSVNGLYVYSRTFNGIFPMLSRSIYSALYLGNELSYKIKESFDYINTALYNFIFPVYHPKKNYLLFYIPMLTGVGSNTAFIYDFQTKTWLKRVVPQDVSIAFRYNDEIYIGTRDGKVLKEFSGLTFDGEPIEFYWRSPWFDFGDGTNELTTKEFRLKISEEFTNRFYLRNRRDGIDTFTERPIDNNLNSFIGLVWDIGYNEGDFNSEVYKTARTVSQVTDGTNIYYIPEDLTEQGSGYQIPNGTMLYNDNTCRDPYGVVGNISGLQQVDPSEGYDETKTEYINAYKYSLQVNQYWRLDNGTDYLWYSGSQDIPKVGDSVKISLKEVKQVAGYTLLISKGNIAAINDTRIYYNVTDRLVEGGAVGYSLDWYRDKDGNQKQYLNSPYGNVWRYLLLRGTSTDVRTAQQILSVGPNNRMLAWSVTRDNWDEYYQTVQEATGSDLSEATNAVVQQVIETADGVFTIKTNLGTFTGMTNRTADGTISNVTIYSKTNGYEENGLLYRDEACTISVGRWLNDGISDNAYYDVNNTTITLNNPTTYQRPIVVYYKKQVIKYTFNGVTEEAENPWVYPVNPVFSDETLTDTVWANASGTTGDSWVRARHIVKRFPLANQYFQTLQIEFYGKGVNEGMSIYGFEIDGVELEEVPVR